MDNEKQPEQYEIVITLNVKYDSETKNLVFTNPDLTGCLTLSASSPKMGLAQLDALDESKRPSTDPVNILVSSTLELLDKVNDLSETLKKS